MMPAVTPAAAPTPAAMPTPPPRAVYPSERLIIDSGREAFLPALQAASYAGRMSAAVVWDADGRPDTTAGLWRKCLIDYAERLAAGMAAERAERHA